MSTSKQNRAKRRVRRARHKKVRQFPITVDIETRMSVMELGTRMHQEIEKVMSGHYHVGDAHAGMPHGPSEQVMAYARAAGIDEVMVIHGGDLIHEVPMHVGTYDIRRARAAMDEFMASLTKPKAER